MADNGLPDGVKVRRRKLSDYQPDPENANLGSERGQQVIEDSLSKLGAGRSILADRDDMLIAGNKTQENAINVGIEDVIEVETDGKTLVVVKRSDLDLDDEQDQRGRQMAYTDNYASQVSLTWSAAQILADQKRGIDLPFTADEMKAILTRQLNQQGGEGPAPRVDIDAVHAEIGAQPGDLWVIPSASSLGGEHRLVCGDSTDAETVKVAMNGEYCVLSVTDPPYGVEYDPKWRAKIDGGPHALGKVANDDRVDWTDAYRLFPGSVIYVWHAGVHAGEVAVNLTMAEFQIRGQIIWKKQNIVMSRGHYHWGHEPCWYAVRKGKTANWKGDRKQSTVWEIANMSAANGSEEDEATGHSTQKPLEVYRRPILNHTDAGDVIYEPFAGSGTALIAAELTSRLSVNIELDERYVSVIIQRAIDAGLSPRLLERDGKRVDTEAKA